MHVKAAVFSFSKIYPNSMVASQRIAMLMAGKLGIPLITEANIKDYDQVDLLIIPMEHLDIVDA